MLVKINKVIFKNKEPIEIEKTKEQEEKITDTWNKFIVGKTDVFNGDIYAVTNIKNNDNYYELEIGKAKFADLIYAKLNNDLTIYSLFTSCLFKTKDNYYVVTKDKRDRLNLLGGMASTDDFVNNIFTPEICLERETKEELGLSINDKSQVSSYHPTFVKIPSTTEKMYPTGVVYTGILNFTKEELEKYFIDHKNNFDNEIKELLFYTKDNYLDIYKEKDIREYIVEAIKLLEESNN